MLSQVGLRHLGDVVSDALISYDLHGSLEAFFALLENTDRKTLILIARGLLFAALLSVGGLFKPTGFPSCQTQVENFRRTMNSWRSETNVFAILAQAKQVMPFSNMLTRQTTPMVMPAISMMRGGLVLRLLAELDLSCPGIVSFSL